MPTEPNNLDAINNPIVREVLGLPPLPIEPEVTAEPCGACGNDPIDCTLCHGCGDCANVERACDGEDYCESCTDDRFFDCSDCGNQTENDAWGSRWENASGDRICEGCAEDYGSCDSCRRTRHNDDLYYRETRDCTYCERCDPGEDYDDEEEEGEYRANPFLTHPTDTFDRIGSRRTFGMELETSSCSGYHELAGATHFGAVYDGSVRGMEFVSAVLSGDRGLSAVEDFCKRANRKGFAVDASCGFHLHIGCKDLSDGQLYAVCAAYACLADVWRSFVAESRRRNNFCGETDWTADDACNAWNDGEEFRYWADRDRYQWINTSAYLEHKTIEIRLHTATLNPVKANNWAMAHLRFVDAVSKLSIGEVMRRFGSGSPSERFARLATILGTDLADYYRERAREFGTVYSTRAARLLPVA